MPWMMLAESPAVAEKRADALWLGIFYALDDKGYSSKDISIFETIPIYFGCYVYFSFLCSRI